MNTKDAVPDGYPASITRILLVEDDPTSRRFLAHAAKGLPAVIDSAGTLGDALEIGTNRCHDLWLVDAHLPDGSGSDLVAGLRRCWPRTPAIAHTASTSATMHAGLVEAGFATVLVKPFPASTLLVALRRVLGGASINEPRVPAAAPAPAEAWDDLAAARALGHDPGHLRALRRLFMDELPMVAVRARAAIAQSDHAGLRDELHRLRASCGFVGAARLGEIARLLHEQPASALLQLQLEHAIAETAAPYLDGRTGRPVQECD